MPRAAMALILFGFWLCGPAAPAPAAPPGAPVREPARQVPVDPSELAEPTENVGGPQADSIEEPDNDISAQEGAAARSDAKPRETTGEPAPAENPEKAAEIPEKVPEEANEAGAAFPGLPVRKPRKPVVRKTEGLRSARKELPPPGSERERLLCKALQSCRNEFVRCKAKIKHPDQSKEWSIAKEDCGAEYKACVEKDFAPGQWFFTRWFYFQELKCE